MICAYMEAVGTTQEVFAAKVIVKKRAEEKSER
jgi:hypothetical protein